MPYIGRSRPLRRPPLLATLLALLVVACSETAPPLAPPHEPGSPDPGAEPDPDPDPDPGPAPSDTTGPGEVLTRLRPGVPIETVEERYGATTVDAVASQRVFLLGLPPGTSAHT